ncbi:MAG: hypothetical protein KAJ46_02630 [Sedimentisphaerales bacterium]|nr:hypothetical protein [Sedimentisphaerales bacterium]
MIFKLSSYLKNQLFQIRIGLLVSGVIILFSSSIAAAAITYPGSQQPGQAAALNGTLQNDLLSLTFDFSGGHLKPNSLTDKVSNSKTICKNHEFFTITIGNKNTIRCSEMKIQKGPVVVNMTAEPDSINLARRFPGKEIKATLISRDNKLQLDWSLILRDGSNYIRQVITLRATENNIRIKKIVLVDLPNEQGSVTGTVSGSPAIAGNMFFAYEHPNSKSEIIKADGQDNHKKRIICQLDRDTLLSPKQGLSQSSVMGVVPDGQLRRGFLYYVERERVSPYRPFLHYNSWYDIAWDGRDMHESECLNVIEHFGKELIAKRGVKMDSFVFDDGWDNHATLWQFNKTNFPNGFSSMTKLAKQYNSEVGTWLSPFGGYGHVKKQRLLYGKQQGFETDRKGFSLAGRKYYACFRQCCVDMIEKYNVNFFKFDGTDAKLITETEAIFRLNSELRDIRPDIFISITTGTWASPFWLLHGDNIWRGGKDMGFFGKGSRREQWITYRDMITYSDVVKVGPLYPLNSLMLCGINNGQRGFGAPFPPFGPDFVHEVRSFFGTGTNLQELYMTPGRMTPAGWDVLAEGAKWSRANSDVLVDTHWIGGDPKKSEVYGWAAWSPRKGILTLRNPGDKPGNIVLDIGKAFELPEGAAQKYKLKSPWKDDKNQPVLTLEAGRVHTFRLQPFDVMVWEATPK